MHIKVIHNTFKYNTKQEQKRYSQAGEARTVVCWLSVVLTPTLELFLQRYALVTGSM